jgi:hypothetical protein
MLGLIFLFLCGWLIYAGLCRLVFGKPDKPEYYIVHEVDIDMVVDEVMERLSEAEQESELELVAEEPRELPDNVVLFDKHR